jgi:hypothetical protein
MHRAALAVLTAAATLAACGPVVVKATPPPLAQAQTASADAASAKAFVAGIYAGKKNFLDDRAAVWDASMLAVLARGDKDQVENDGLIFDFDPLCQCQDDTGMAAAAGEATITGPDAASVPVTLTFPAETSTLTLKLSRAGGQWRVHDITTPEMPSYAAHLEALIAGE